MRSSDSAADVGLLALRVAAGGLLAGHGAQKLFGAFGGPGHEATRRWLESIGIQPGRLWALAAGMSEFGGGTLTALGLLHPTGPIVMMAPMAMATGKVHWGKPIWATAGGAELPVLNMAIAVALGLVGPGRLSLDGLLGLKLSRPAVAAAIAATATGTVAGFAGSALARHQSPPNAGAQTS